MYSLLPRCTMHATDNISDYSTCSRRHTTAVHEASMDIEVDGVPVHSQQGDP